MLPPSAATQCALKLPWRTRLDVLETEAIKNAEVVGKHMMKRLSGWVKTHPMVGDVRGRGLMIGVEIVKTKDQSHCP